LAHELRQALGGARTLACRVPLVGRPAHRPVTSRARSVIPSSQLLHPDVIPYGARASTASICRSLPFSTLNISASSQVHGCVGPATTARPLGVSKCRVFPAE